MTKIDSFRLDFPVNALIAEMSTALAHNVVP